MPSGLNPSPKSVDPAEAIDLLLGWTQQQAKQRSRPGFPWVTFPWVILIDGRSGSGKTTFAKALLRATTQAHQSAYEPAPELSPELVARPTLGGHLRTPQLVQLDDFYPGWGGLFAARRMVATDILHPNSPGFRRWDWGRNAPAAWQQLDPRRPMIIEGVGAISPHAQALLEYRGIPFHTVVLDAPTRLRRYRALTRDPYYHPWWGMWAAQEQAHLAQRPTPRLVVRNYEGPSR